MRLQVGRNFEFILDNFVFDKPEKQGFVLEGGSGSAKTWDITQFLMYYCQMNENKNKDILIFRQFYADLKKTVLKDFVKILKMYGLYNEAHHVKSHPQAYHLFGNIIYFTGLDGMGSHGERHDIIWGNEGMELNFEDFKQLNQRCNEAFFIDYNPSFTQHWIFSNIIPRKDTFHIRTTQLDNPFLPTGQRNEILAYEPWEPGSYEVTNEGELLYNGKEVDDKNQPPPHMENINQGTADEFMWKVYGLGLRGAMRGQIFKNIKWIDKFPDHLAFTYGLDFGFVSDPTALVKFAKEGKDIYMELLIYTPISTPEALDESLKSVGVSKFVPITADSSDKYVSEKNGAVRMVRDLFDVGWEISKVSKTKAVIFWLQKMTGCRIHVVKNRLWQHVKTEQENYVYMEVNGIQINKAVESGAHFWDAGRYAFMSWDVDNMSADVS